MADAAAEAAQPIMEVASSVLSPALATAPPRLASAVGSRTPLRELASLECRSGSVLGLPHLARRVCGSHG